jgi:hypothetical protein
MSLKWYIRRLRSMQPAEIAARVEERLKRDLARNRLEGWARYEADGPTPVLPGLREAVLSNGPRVAALAAAEAAEVRQGRFKALGVTWPLRSPDALFEPQLWRLDPVTGGLWPGAEQYCFDIPYRHERTLGDIKYVWEINRLQFLQVLAVDALVNASAESAAVAEAAIQSWCDANPPFRGLGWNSGIELALRAISLLVVSSLCGERLSGDTIRKLRAALHAHLVWIDRYPSRFSSANNHLVAEAAGQFLIALAMPELRGAETHLRKARGALETEALKQIFADGVGAEQSPTYGAFTVEFVLLCAAAAEAAGQPLERTAVERLAAFSRYVAWIAGPDGRTPAIGDDDEGRVLTSGRQEQTYAVSVARAVLGVSGTADPGLPAAEPELRDAVFASPLAIAPAPEGLTTFAEGGYSVVRERRRGRDLTLVLDHGPLGYLSIAAHGHADALAFTLDLDGRRVLVDPGTYLYHSGGAWRDWFRGTRAHNTLALADADQSVITGAFNWGRKASAMLEQARPGADWSLTASHDGYVSTQGVVHRRAVRALPEGLEIHDRLEPAASTHATVTFQFAPEVSATRNGGQIEAAIDGKSVLALEFDAPGEVSLGRGGPLGQGGWISPCFGVKIEAPVVRWRGLIPPSGLRTIIKLS